MKQAISHPKKSTKIEMVKSLPILITRDEDGFYFVECPVLSGCFTQGRSVDEALKNIREVIDLVLEEPDQRELLEAYDPTESGIYSLSVSL
jgi:predicted RNase H-like HicB family nuclease